MEKPSGFVLWIVVDRALNLDSFLWYGGLPGTSLPDIAGLKVAKHNKGDATGKKGERPDHRVLKRRQFEKLTTLDEVLKKLFGAMPGQKPPPYANVRPTWIVDVPLTGA